MRCRFLTESWNHQLIIIIYNKMTWKANRAVQSSTLGNILHSFFITPELFQQLIKN